MCWSHLFSVITNHTFWPDLKHYFSQVWEVNIFESNYTDCLDEKKSTLMSKRQTWVELLYFVRLIDFFQFHRPVHFWVSVFILIFSHPCDQAKLFSLSLLSCLWSTSCCFSCDLAECVNVGSGHWCYGDIASYQNIPSISNIQPSGHKISIEIPSQEKY